MKKLLLLLYKPQAITASRLSQQTLAGPGDAKSSRDCGGRRVSQW